MATGGKGGPTKPAKSVKKKAGKSTKPASKNPLVQPRFDPRINSLSFPGTGKGSGTIERGYMIWDQPLPGYSSKATFHYLYNPSTLSSDYSIADPSTQAAMNFPIASDTAQLAIPLNQNSNWTVMFDRTYEVNHGGIFNDDGTLQEPTRWADNDPRVIGVQADVMQMMQFTGMMINYQYGTATSSAPSAANVDLSANQGIMQLVPMYAYFGNASLKNNVAYYGYITDWGVQYTHWTQYNVPFRAVIDISVTMLPPPSKTTNGGIQAPTGSGDQNQNWNLIAGVSGLASGAAAGITSTLKNIQAPKTGGHSGR